MNIQNKKRLWSILISLSVVAGLALIYTASMAFAQVPEDHQIMSIVGSAEASAQGATVYLEGVEVGGETINIALCADLPDLGDWFPVVAVSSEKGSNSEYSATLRNGKDPSTIKSTSRCFDFVFENTLGLTSEDSFAIEVGSLVKYLDPLTEQGYREVLEAVQATNPDVVFEFQVESGDDGGGATLIITSKPDSLSNEDVMNLIVAASEPKLHLGAEFDVAP